MVAYHFRVTKYNPSFRDRNDLYLGDEWTNWHDIGRELDGHVLTEDEFEAAINKYLYALEAFAHESGVDYLTVLGLHPEYEGERSWGLLRNGTRVSLDAAVDLVQTLLRGEASGVRLEDATRFYVHADYCMEMWIGSDVDCVSAVAEAERIGLFVERGIASPLLDPGERFWWLREGLPVRHILTSYDPSSAADDRQDVPDDKVPALRALFAQNPDDENFYDLYRIDKSLRSRVSEILGIPLDPQVRYSLWTRWVDE